MDRRLDRRSAFKNTFSALVFILFFLILFFALCCLFQPAWTEWNNYDSFHGFYREPDNTIETIFLGPSLVINGINPMLLYG